MKSKTLSYTTKQTMEIYNYFNKRSSEIPYTESKIETLALKYLEANNYKITNKSKNYIEDIIWEANNHFRGITADKDYLTKKYKLKGKW